jgi:Protein of unknown function (DUF4238)
MAEHKKQHFVPQFYMKNFSADAERRRISLYAIGAGRHVAGASIKDQAHKEYFYGKAGVEDKLSQLEAVVSPIIAKAIADNTLPELMSEGHLMLLTFVLFQDARTPAMAARMNERTEKKVKMIAKQFPDLKADADKMKVSDPNAPLTALQIAEELRPFVLDLRWKLLENKTRRFFITSDNPVVLYNRFLEKRQPQTGNTGLNCRGLQIFMPLGPRHLLMLYDGDVYRFGSRNPLETLIEIIEWDVEALNVLQAANAHGVLYFHADTDLQQLRDTVKRAERYRGSSRVEIKECVGIGPGGQKGPLIMSLKPELRVGLALDCVGIIPAAAGQRLEDSLALLRDPERVRRFQEARMKGGYDARRFIESYLGR